MMSIYGTLLQSEYFMSPRHFECASATRFNALIDKRVPCVQRFCRRKSVCRWGCKAISVMKIMRKWRGTCEPCMGQSLLHLSGNGPFEISTPLFFCETTDLMVTTAFAGPPVLYLRNSFRHALSHRNVFRACDRLARGAASIVASSLPPVTSLQNPRVKAARALLRRRARTRDSALLVEGHRLVLDAIEAGCVLRSLFYTDEALGRGGYGQRLRDVVAGRAKDKAMLVTPEVVESISATVTPQGCVAVVEQMRRDIPADSSLLLVCDGVQDPGNVGTLIRAAAGAGVDGVILSHGCADVWGLKALRAGMGAQMRMPVVSDLQWDGIARFLENQGSWDVCIADGDDVLDLGSSPANKSAMHAVSYDTYDWRRRSVLVVGSEGGGPSLEAYALASRRVSIPLASGVESLNAAVAGAVILFEAARQRCD